MPVGPWEDICWFVDKEVAYLELQLQLSEKCRVERHLFLAQQDRFALLADAIFGPRSARWEYQGRVALAESVALKAARGSHEGFLMTGRGRALVLPLALPEWRGEPSCGAMEAARGTLSFPAGRGAKPAGAVVCRSDPRRCLPVHLAAAERGRGPRQCARRRGCRLSRDGRPAAVADLSRAGAPPIARCWPTIFPTRCWSAVSPGRAKWSRCWKWSRSNCMSDLEVLLTSRKFRVVRMVQTEPGRKGARPRRGAPSGAVVLLPLLDDGRICLIRNYRASVAQTLLELPAGTLDPGEEPAATASRELIEETGYRAARLELLRTFYASPGVLDERMYLYLATGLTPGPPAREPGEEITNALFTLDEVMPMVRDGRIQDGKTLVALLDYYVFRRKA